MNSDNLREIFRQLGDYIEALEKRISDLEREMKELKSCPNALETRIENLEGGDSSPSEACVESMQDGTPQNQVEAEPPAENATTEEVPKETYYSARAKKGADKAYFEQGTFKTNPFFYIIEAIGDTAVYRLNTEDDGYQKRYISDFENSIVGSCKVEGPTKSNGKLCNVKEGRLHREDDKWIIDEFLIVKFE